MSSCSDDFPYAKTYFDDISTLELVCVILSGVFTVYTIILFVFKARHELRHADTAPPEPTILKPNQVSAADAMVNGKPITVQPRVNGQTLVKGNPIPGNGMANASLETYIEKKRKKIVARRHVQLIGIFPIVSLTAMLALCIPRATYVADFIAKSYMAVCVYNLTSLMINYFSDKHRLYQEHNTVSLRAPPLCCCICCLPTVAVNKVNTARIKRLVSQNVILCPLVSLTILALWLDGRYDENKFDVDEPFPYLTALSTVSTLLCLYGLSLTVRLCYGHLKREHKARFYLLQATLILYNVQKAILVALDKRDVPECRKTLSSKVRGQAIYQMFLVFEMLILSVVATCVFKHRQ